MYSDLVEHHRCSLHSTQTNDLSQKMHDTKGYAIDLLISRQCGNPEWKKSDQ